MSKKLTKAEIMDEFIRRHVFTPQGKYNKISDHLRATCREPYFFDFWEEMLDKYKGK